MERYKLQVSEEPAGTEEGRRPTVVPAGKPVKPDPEVAPGVKRRYLTVAYKVKVLDTVAALRVKGQGEVGAYLRKEGLYYSSIRSWQKLRDQGLLGKDHGKQIMTVLWRRTSGSDMNWKRHGSVLPKPK